MRRLILMRHAKSAWDTGVADHARPLNARGKAAAPRVAAALESAGWLPELVLLSDSKRTKQTLKRMHRAWSVAPPAVALSALYHAGLPALESALLAHAAELQTVLALGHNPGWSDALFSLAGLPHPLKTADAACLSSGAESWAEALRGPWSVSALIRARALEEAQP